MEYQVKLDYNRRLTRAFPSLGIIGYARHMKIGQEDLNNFFQKDIAEFGKSLLGNPYWDQITLESISVGEEPLIYQFPNDPIVDVFMTKKVTETEIFGGKSVIEESGYKSAQFRIRGVLWNNDQQYPEDQLADLLEIFREKGEVNVVSSRFFSMLNIQSLFIESISLPGIEGFSDSQPFVITCREVQNVILDLKVDSQNIQDASLGGNNNLRGLV